MPLSRVQRAKASGIALGAFPILSVLARTISWRVDGREHFEALQAQGRAPIFAFWHGRILPATYYWRDRGIVAMASENFDGEWIARLIARFGYGVARGSTSRGGSRALVQLRRDLDRGRAAAFTVDGPRGPARAAQPGAVWLAGATRHPVLPFHIELDRYWAARSWDRTMVPKPFSTAAIAIGEPMNVPDTNAATVEDCRRELERRLTALEARCRTLLEE